MNEINWSINKTILETNHIIINKTILEINHIIIDSINLFQFVHT